MNRLTKKFEDNSGYEPIENHNVCNITLYDFNFDDYDRCINKLGKLEDLEEELGCPLEVVFKSMIDYSVEYKIRDEIVVGSMSSIYKSVGGKWFGKFIPKKYILGTREYYTTNIELNQYKKTWWLRGEKDNE